MPRMRKLRLSQGKWSPTVLVQCPAGTLPVVLSHSSGPGHGSEMLSDLVSVTMALGMTKGGRGQMILECQGSGAGNGMKYKSGRKGAGRKIIVLAGCFCL